MELAKLRALIRMLREEGVTYHKDGELELTLGPAPTQHVGKEETQQDPEATELDKALSHLPGNYRAAFTTQAGGL